MPVFYHEKLPVYRDALGFAVAASAIADRLPRIRHDLKVQLWRASSSVPFNIAEACGGLSDPMRLKHFRIARGSAAECAAIFDYIAATALLPAEDLPYALLNSIGAQLGTAVFKHLGKKEKT